VKRIARLRYAAVPRPLVTANELSVQKQYLGRECSRRSKRTLKLGSDYVEQQAIAFAKGGINEIGAAIL